MICLLGQGSFAKVFLVKKTPAPQESNETVAVSNNYFAMKVLDKSLLKEKDYIDYIKLEKKILVEVVHPFILKLHYSFQCK